MFVTSEGKTIPVDVPFILDDIQYPANWLRLTSEEEKEAAGIFWVEDQKPFNPQFYWGYDAEGKLIPKLLDDEPAVDEDGAPILDSEGNQMINRGIRSQFITEQKQIANTLLAATDWYITRQFETSVEVPTEVLDYRAAVRAACDEREMDIVGVDTVDELAALFTNSAKVYDSETGLLADNTEPFITPWPETAR